MKGKATPILTLVKGGILIGIVLFIYLKFSDRDNLMNKVWFLITAVPSSRYPIFWYAIILMPLNWFLEALKWKLLARKIVQLSFLKALKGVFSGLTLSFITPHGLGDYLGRIGLLDQKNRGELIGAVFIGRVSQMVATILFGTIGVVVLFGFQRLFWPVAMIILAMFLIFLIRKALKVTTIKNKLFFKVRPYLKIMVAFGPGELSRVFFYSVVRYVIFSLQFFLILDLFLPWLDDALKFAGITWIFLAKSMLPTFNFMSDLGVREVSAIYFFENFNVPVEPVVAASLIIWLINILIPTILGLPLVLQLKFRPA